MAFLDRYTPTQYRIRRILLEPVSDGAGGTDVTATFELVLYDTEGRNLTHAKETIILSPTEEQQLRAFVNIKREGFEQATGLTWYNVAASAD